jgi:hypothetical protein
VTSGKGGETLGLGGGVEATVASNSCGVVANAVAPVEADVTLVVVAGGSPARIRAVLSLTSRESSRMGENSSPSLMSSVLKGLLSSPSLLLLLSSLSLAASLLLLSLQRRLKDPEVTIVVGGEGSFVGVCLHEVVRGMVV